MRNFIAGIFAALIAAAGLGAIVWIVVLPRIDWGASNPPGAVEQALARNVLARWILRNARTGTNPLAPKAETLKAARTEYEEHCAACHGLDGSGRNRFQADFYPPVAKLTGGVQKLSDSEIYFIVAQGIRNTARPAFGKAHSPGDMACRSMGAPPGESHAWRERGDRTGGSTRDDETRTHHGARYGCRHTNTMIWSGPGST